MQVGQIPWIMVLPETPQARKTDLYPERLFLPVKMNLYPLKGGNGPRWYNQLATK